MDVVDANAALSSKSFQRSQQHWESARRIAPGGVHSNMRLVEQPCPLFFESAIGSKLRDVDGNEFIDYVLGFGPLILGHRPRMVVDAVRAQLERGLLYGAQHALEIEVAQRIIRMIPSAEVVRFETTGTQAVQAALRIAKTATGRSKFLKFQGHYHGWLDNVLWNVGTSSRPVADNPHLLEPVPESAGIGISSSADLLVTEWNDPGALRRVLQDYGEQIAAVIMEPVMSSPGVILPHPGYLEEARKLTSKYGCVLIFDEVITGFRVAAGGAQAHFGVTPDITVFGKAVASGFPVAGIAGRADLFEPMADRRLMHVGTFNSNPIGMAAANATLGVLGETDGGTYRVMGERGAALLKGLQELAAKSATPVVIQGLPSLFSVAFRPGPQAYNHREAVVADTTKLQRFSFLLAQRGIRITGRGNLYLSAAHSREDVELTLSGFSSALELLDQ